MLSPSHTLTASMRCFESVAHPKQACSPHKDYHVLAALQNFDKMLRLNLEPFKRLDALSIKHKRIRGLLMGLTCDENTIDTPKLSKSRWTIGIHLELICWFFRNKSRYIVSIAIHEIRRQNRFSFWTLCILEPMIASEQVVDESILVAFLLHPWWSALTSRLCQNWR